MKKDDIRALADALQAYAPEETILVTGSRSEGRRILSAVASQGYVLLGVRAETPFSLAQELCASEWSRSDTSFRFISEMEGAEILRSCIAENNSGIYSGVSAKTLSAARAMFRTFQEMDIAGLPKDLKGHEEVQKQFPKLKELQNLRSAYMQKLADQKGRDRGGILAEAICIAQTDSDQPLHSAHYVVLGDYAPAPQERKLLDILTAETNLTVVKLTCADGMELPAGIMTDRLHRKNAVQAVQEKTPRFIACRGKETEVCFPFRDMLDRYVQDKTFRAEECAIVYLNGSYAQPLYEQAARFHIPVTMGNGLPLSGSLLYTTLKQVVTLAKTDFYAETVCALLESSGCTPEKPLKLVKRLRQKKVGWGRERYARVFQEDVEQIRPQDMTDEKWTGTLTQWRNFLHLLLDVVQPGERTLAQQKEDMLAFLCFCNHRQSEAAAVDKAEKLVSQIVGLEEGETLLQRLLTMMETTSYLGGSVEPGAVYCASLSQAVCTGRKHLYVVGLSRYAVQGERKESPVLLDRERTALGMKTSVDLGREQEFRLLTLLVRHEGSLVLTYPDFDSDGMLPQEPAPFFREAGKGYPLEKVTYIPKTVHLGVDSFFGSSKLDLAPVFEAPIPSDTKAAALSADKSRRDQMESMVFSATMLEDAIRCPYQFFLKRLMKLYVPQRVLRREDQWLTPAEKGSFCHDVLERYYLKFNRKNLVELEKIFEESFPALQETAACPSQALRLETKEELWQILVRAVDWTDGHNRVPIACEESFRIPMTFQTSIQTKPKAKKTVMNLKWDLEVQGKIDRVDELPDGSLCVLDYKTGDPEKFREEKARHWQHYIYTLAEESLHPDRAIEEAGYLFLQEDAKTNPYDGETETQDLRRLCSARIAWLLEQIADKDKSLKYMPCYAEKATSKEGSGEMKSTNHDQALRSCVNWCDYAMVCPKQKDGGYDD